MKIAIIVTAAIILLLAWWFSNRVLVYFAASHTVFRYFFLSCLILVGVLIFLIKLYWEECTAREKEQKVIRGKEEALKQIDAKLKQELNEKKQIVYQLEAMKKQQRTMEDYQEKLKKLSNINRRMVRDLKNARNRLAHIKRERQCETALDSSPT